MTLRKTVAISPADRDYFEKNGFHTLFFHYHLGTQLHLYRSDPVPRSPGGILGVRKIAPGSRFSLSRCVWELLEECRLKQFCGIFLEDADVSRPLLLSLLQVLIPEAEKRQITVYVTEENGNLFPGVHPVLTTAVSGGSLERRLTDAAAVYGANKLALDVERVCHRFSLPSPGGQGSAISRQELTNLLSGGVQTFYSAELCTNYCTVREQGHTEFILFDTVRTFRKKLALAERLQIRDAFFLYGEVCDWLDEL